ncbi:hypothetical protein CEXT_535981 [Caerostris extrusa]|uniref:Uncharacterized protein n=1 Tax=Caerostris extrusa TaxID=172846 RepID=A0AAV4QI85_CAEEX|nr:hypothetical protein CEXT_535981 [Caerostris extrusa]
MFQFELWMASKNMVLKFTDLTQAGVEDQSSCLQEYRINQNCRRSIGIPYSFYRNLIVNSIRRSIFSISIRKPLFPGEIKCGYKFRDNGIWCWTSGYIDDVATFPVPESSVTASTFFNYWRNQRFIYLRLCMHRKEVLDISEINIQHKYRGSDYHYIFFYQIIIKS